MAAELSDERRALLDWIALEFLHNSWAGRRLLAVEGATDGPAARFADDLADVLRERYDGLADRLVLYFASEMWRRDQRALDRFGEVAKALRAG